VEARNGDIYYLQADGTEKRLTNLGKDYDPSLSGDRTLIVFARKTKVAPYEFRPSEMQIIQSEIWTVDVEGKHGQLVVGGPLRFNGRSFCAFSSPQLSPDNRRIYFLVDFAAVTHAIFQADVQSHASKFVGAAMFFWVVPRGEYSGYLVVQQRRVGPGALSPDYLYWLIDQDGNTMGFVGKEESDVKTFLTTRALRTPPY
jgi:hypothetical protein